jgi:hypothetical protein
VALTLGWLALFWAAIPAAMLLRNMRLYRPAPRSHGLLPPVSVLIPARNEEKTIGAAVAAVLSNEDISFEVIVLDDASTDATALVVEAIADVDPRAKLIRGAELPEGWCGKQHACAELARHARHSILCFLDADVRLRCDALVRMVSFLQKSGAELCSGVPLQETGTFFERLLIPLIHYVLLAFLPMKGMRRSNHPSYAAGCGQLFIARAGAYRVSGGHAAIRSTLHDGINLPRAFRRAGFRTDLFDATAIASCRMYASGPEVWRGLRKNAIEGLGSPALIVPATLILAAGQILPFAGAFVLSGLPRTLCFAALSLPILCRVYAMHRFHQPLSSALLHPLGILLLLAIQWQAFLRNLTGTKEAWKGRSYTPASS